jgi:outer membrane murein-binding lipoprotein Lpp
MQSFGIAVAALVLAGCANHHEEDRARLAQIEADGEALNQAADALEARLLADRARVALWSELKERHQHVSAIATDNANEHVEAMVRYFAKQERRGKRLRQRRVASADPFAFGEGKGSRKRTHLRHDK